MWSLCWAIPRASPGKSVQASDHVVRAVHLAVQVVKLSAQEAGPDQHVVEPDSLGPKKALRHSEPILGSRGCDCSL